MRGTSRLEAASRRSGEGTTTGGKKKRNRMPQGIILSAEEDAVTSLRSPNSLGQPPAGWLAPCHPVQALSRPAGAGRSRVGAPTDGLFQRAADPVY